MDRQVFLLHQQFNDFEAYCENARHWDLDYYQLDRGAFSSKRLMFGDDSTIFSNARLGRRMLQKGTTPSGLITFGLLAQPNISIHWRNHDISGDKLFIFPPSGELYSVTQPDFDVFALSLSEETLNRTCHSLELPDFRQLVSGNEVFNCHPQSIFLLRQWLQKTAFELASTPPAGSSLSMRLQQLEEELARRLITSLAESRGHARKPVMRRRDTALKAAVDFIFESDRPVTSVQELCSIAHVSERTLEYAFHEHLGLPPKTFTLTHRLNNVRKMLTHAEPTFGRIKEIAERHEFFHMGQFTSDYKRLFGELPSATLNRS
jgi:AraC family transcriptional regulator, ethanolamine operon transcriptional activator